MEIFKLLGTIAIANDEANSELDETTDKAQDTQKRISDSFKKIGTAVAMYFTTQKIIEFGKACLETAANAQAMGSQFSQVFGDFEDVATAHLTSIAEEAGIVENRLKGSYTQIAAFAKTTGMDTEAALSLADRALVAVADSAAFYDRSLESVTESLQSFLKGNYENDAALGLSCTETTRNAAANELYGKSFNDLSEAQKQLTLLKMVEDANALSGALGQASRESDTWANQTGNLQQAWTDFTAMIGTHFLPIAISVVTVLQQMVTWMTEHESVIAILAVGVGTLTAAIVAYNVAQTLATTGMTLATAAGTAFGAVMAFITSPITLVVAAIGALVAAGVLLYQNWDTIKVKASELWTNLQATFERVKTSITNVWSGIWGSTKMAVNNIIGGVETMVNSVVRSINNIISGINSVISEAGELVGLTVAIPTLSTVNLPRLEKGGVLEKGQVGLLEGNGAEAVVPLDQNRAWVSAVAKDMNSAVGGNNEQTQRIIDLLEMLVDILPATMVEAMKSLKFDINNREFARLVKAVE